jgi:hypothetical protein
VTAIRALTTVKPDGTIEVRNPALPAGEQVEVIVLLPASKQPEAGEAYAFLKVLENANLDGPPDWSEHLDDYLYHGKNYDGKQGVP